MTVIGGIIVGLLLPVLFTHAGKAWGFIYGGVFVAAVFVMDVGTGDLTYRESSWLLVAFAVGVFLGWALIRADLWRRELAAG